MRIRKNRRGMDVGDATEREILRRQMELLAEGSTDYTYASDNTYAMIKLYKLMSKPRLFIIDVLLFYSVVSISVIIIKFFRGHFSLKAANIN